MVRPDGPGQRSGVNDRRMNATAFRITVLVADPLRPGPASSSSRLTTAWKGRELSKTPRGVSQRRSI
jgi:hypothetical protein